MRIKPGASLQGLQPVMRKVLLEADEVWQENGHPEGATITSGTDGVHSAGSVHYYGYAVDVRTRDDAPAVVDGMARDLQRRLGPRYQVVVEPTHVHVEWWPARHLPEPESER